MNSQTNADVVTVPVEFRSAMERERAITNLEKEIRDLHETAYYYAPVAYRLGDKITELEAVKKVPVKVHPVFTIRNKTHGTAITLHADDTAASKYDSSKPIALFTEETLDRIEKTLCPTKCCGHWYEAYLDKNTWNDFEVTSNDFVFFGLEDESAEIWF